MLHQKSFRITSCSDWDGQREPAVMGSFQSAQGSVFPGPEVCHDNAVPRLHSRHGPLADLLHRNAKPEGGPLNAATVISPMTSSATVALDNACLVARLAADHKA